MIRPIYQPLNDAVLAISVRLFPNGFDVVESGAPETLAELNALMATGQRFRVWSGASDDTIFGDPAVNHAFRAWHDWTHWTHQTAFDLLGEREICNAQMRDVYQRAAWGTMSRETFATICDLLRAEVIGQAEHHAKHGHFPVRQREFTLAYMARMVGKEPW